MPAAEILNQARNLERFDFLARRNYGLSDSTQPHGPLNLHILTDQAAIQVNAPRTSHYEQLG
jgi:hypothetical protein